MVIATRINEPAIEPLTLAEVKPDCRVMLSDMTFDGTLTRLIKAARWACEERTQRALISQGWRATDRGFPCASRNLSLGETQYWGTIYLPRPNLISVESVKYIDGDGAQQTLDPSSYGIDTDEEPGIIFPKTSDYRWPSTGASPVALKIEYTSGYGDTADKVPANLLQWMMGLVAYWFENPPAAQTIPGLTASVPAQFLSELITPAIVHHVGNSR